MIVFDPVAIGSFDMDAIIAVSADRTVSNGISGTLAAVEGVHINAVVGIAADRTIGNYISVTFAGRAACEVNSISAVVTDSAIGDERPIHTFRRLLAKYKYADRVVTDGAVGDNVAIAVAGGGANINALIAIANDSAVTHRISVACTGIAVETDTRRGITGNR